ncbi:hypothetical protein J4457_05200 [Candidatus Woesearchaeota archaeon]|nr:hypothetical protein [Candidatus Woesearchaeota archaeon]
MASKTTSQKSTRSKTKSAPAAQPLISSGKPNQTMATVALLLNVLVLPGLGSIIGGKTNVGITQLVLFLVSIPLMFILIGIPIMIGVWIWGIVTGVQILKEAQA